MAYQIEPGTKFVAIAEIVRLATDEDLGVVGADPDYPYSHNKWQNKYLCMVCGKELIVCIDQPEEFLKLVKAAKYFEQEWEEKHA